ncbi:hypothetical protein [Sporosarcina limicola]|uniref:N-acetyl-gamma-glutamylphosphate reductase n=1 Tax=Sporosarcina limicola TaxID=34101 RepID=A0A927REI3_9BACL|nr:hypothetical protein [Sporosarcina limicola]MBE1556350.1 N-acetyl-gamma-glutamylphosphate reductase [Sporosarcina limicola]
MVTNDGLARVGALRGTDDAQIGFVVLSITAGIVVLSVIDAVLEGTPLIWNNFLFL